MPIARHHTELLSLLDISGPLLSMPVLLRDINFVHGEDVIHSSLTSSGFGLSMFRFEG
jgi:hypothetical protein